VDSAILVNGGSTITGNAVEAAMTAGSHELYGGAIASSGNSGLVVVSDATIMGNSLDATSSGGATVGLGGAIYVTGGEVDLSPGALIDGNAVNLADDLADGRGGGIALEMGGTTDATEATLSGNTVTVDAGDAGDGRGGGLYVSLSNQGAFLTDSTVSGNTVTVDGTNSGLAMGGGVHAQTGNIGLAEFIRSTVSGNQATGDHDSDGGGLSLGAGNATAILSGFFRNATLSGNTSDATGTARGGGAFSESTANQDNDLTFINSTITGNTATDEGGGLMLIDGGGGGTSYILRHSILYNDTATTGSECSGALTLTNVNALGPTLTGCTVDTTNQVLMDPSLGTLGDNGGPTQTHDIDNMSAAYNAGAATCQDNGVDITIDQRSLPRAGNCTLGSYEPQ
jgi:hypothetical protein